MATPFLEGKRAWQPRELAMATEFMVREFPGVFVQTRVRLGIPHPKLVFENLTDEELALLRVYSRWVDGIAYLKDKVVLVECKVRPNLGPLDALDLYENLFKTDPLFAPHWHKQVEKWFVYAIEDPVLVRMAQKRGIVTRQYVPTWLPEYTRILKARETRAPLTAEVE